VWAIGTIFVEMVTKRPLFPGDSEIDQLFKIFRSLGTPDETMWPGVTQLQDWNAAFPAWPRLPVEKMAPSLDDAGNDLLEKLLLYTPRDRISAKEALNHPYFDDLEKDSI